ncbi:MAG: hypothetical protein ACRC9L_09175 [Brevinema sp.]
MKKVLFFVAFSTLTSGVMFARSSTYNSLKVVADIMTQASRAYESTNTNNLTNRRGKKSSIVAMDIMTQASRAYESTNTNNLTNRRGKKSSIVAMNPMFQLI